MLENRSFYDFLLSLGYNRTSSNDNIDFTTITSIDLMIEHNTDVLFGMDTDVVYVGNQLNEIVTLGTKLYIFTIDSIITEILKSNFSYDGYLKRDIKYSDYQQIYYTDDLYFTFFPNRFAFGEDWSRLNTGKQMFTYQSATTLTVLFDPHPSNQESLLNATRTIVRTTPGNQQQVSSSIIVPDRNFLSKAIPFSSFFTYESIPCYPGSYNPSYGFSPCLLCPVGSYQSVEGTTGCLLCSNDSYCPRCCVSECYTGGSI